MDRADGDGIGAVLGGAAGEIFQRRKIADAAIAVAAQANKAARRGPRVFRRSGGVLQGIGAVRRDRDGGEWIAEFQPVIAGFVEWRAE